MEPMTRIELVTSPLPRGCSTAKLHGHGTNYYGTVFALSRGSPRFLYFSWLTGNLPRPSLESWEATGKCYLALAANGLGGAGFEPA
jgi:hypothetical protein